MSNKKETLIDVNGLVIKTNSVYKITNKPDSNAPSGFVKEGTTKLPSAGIANTVPCRFKVTNKSTGEGLYDTGLYRESPCYASMNEEKVDEIVKNLQEKIVIPYERKYGKGKLDHSNTEFWDAFGVNLFDGRFFVTSNIDDLLDLYIAMNGFDLTPKDRLGDPRFSSSDYCVEDKEKVQGIKAERANNMMTAITNFGSLLSTNRNKALNILRYNKVIGVGSDIDDGTLNSLVFEWLNKDTQNPNRFLKTYELTKKKKTEDVVDMYAILSKLFNKGVVKRNGGMFNFEGNDLGADLKTAAYNVATKGDLADVKIALIEYDE